ncbi:hypothetical protein [Pseudomonas sp. BF-R-21]|uniref:hypothetical protein n=1 Tax=Pseudomonas sp. BF-R-21 TaxID=2832387 RepID=UPI001CC1BBE1|nr:hypothetical protein [Pseudomonas sp. BF-R-21]
MSKQMFDVAKLVEHFGGRSNLHARLLESGEKITIRAIDQWLYRGRIPSAVLATMLRLSVLSGEPLDLAKFTKRADQQQRPDSREPIDSLLD